MLPPSLLQLVPASLIVFTATAPALTRAREIPWPFGSRSLQRSLQDADLPERDGPYVANSPTQMLIGIRKMSGDEAEMFFPEYWSFETTSDHNPEVNLDKRVPTLHSLKPFNDREASAECTNASMPQPLQAPFALHANEEFDDRPLLRRLLNSPRATFHPEKRDFQCPGDTTVCSSINQPNSCCPAGTTCQSITDSGNGAVGCCPSGQTCSEQVSDCQAPDISCPESSGGGCCIPGYICSGVGCKCSLVFQLD